MKSRGPVPTPHLDRSLEALRRRWRTRAVLRGTLWATAAAGAAVLLLALAAQGGLLPAEARPLARWLPAVAASSVLVGWTVRLLRSPSEGALALRLEEGDPTLEHLPTTLIGLADDEPYGALLRERAEARLARSGAARGFPAVPSQREAGSGALLVAVAAGILVLAGGPAEAWARWGAPGADAVGVAPPPSAATPSGAPSEAGAEILDALRFRVEPPAYTGLPTEEEWVEEGIRAYPGSRIHLAAAAASRETLRALRITAEEEPAPLGVQAGAGAGGWTVDWVLGPRDRGVVVELEGGAAGPERRVIPIRPLPDGPPIVELLEPARDLTLARGEGRLRFRARASDPFGVEDFRLEWVHTRGGGESFDFREGTWTWEELSRDGGAVEGVVTVDLARVGLGAGEVLHVRAAARDVNDVTGPGTGVSRTRQLRVIREGEEMQVDALIGFPLDARGEPVLSQRMILLLTEALLERAGELSTEAFGAEAERIAGEQARLRAEIGEQVYSRATGGMEPVPLEPSETTHAHAHAHAEGPPADPAPPDAAGSRYGVPRVFDPSAPTGFGELEELGHDHDGDPILSVNRPLLAVYDAMWSSERLLRRWEARGSVPHQEEALRMLQALREGERVFARGHVRVPPVDVAGVRGTGEVDDARPAPRSPGDPGAPRGARLGEVESLLGALRSSPPGEVAGRIGQAAVLLLSDPSVPPEAAALVARAVDRARRGDGPGAEGALLQARLLLAPDRRVGGGDPVPAPRSVAGATLSRRSPDAVGAGGASVRIPVVAGESAPPFVFATLRYESGNWDSAPLVPQNLIHALAQYTDLAVAPEGVEVDLSSPEIFRYPVLYLTGHLPVRFSDAEARNLEAYVERGGFVFMDDHNHDIDGAFHRTATAELARIFGEDALQPLENDHELYRVFFHFEDGPPTTAHELSGWGDGLVHPELHAVRVDGRIGVLYSNKDYSSEWSYHAVNKRFLAVDNTRFGVNLILYALTR